MKKATFAIAAAALFATTGSAAAQLSIPLSVEVRADMAIPSGDFADAVEGAPGFGVNASLGIAPGLAVYGGYSRTQFEIKETEVDATDQGFSAGLTAGLPFAAPLQPWVGAGLLIHDFEVEDVDADFDSDLGFEVGAGLAVPLARNVRLTPGVGYRRYTTDVPLFGGTEEAEISYFTAGVGLNLSF